MLDLEHDVKTIKHKLWASLMTCSSEQNHTFSPRCTMALRLVSWICPHSTMLTTTTTTEIPIALRFIRAHDDTRRSVVVLPRVCEQLLPVHAKYKFYVDYCKCKLNEMPIWIVKFSGIDWLCACLFSQNDRWKAIIWKKIFTVIFLVR